MKLLSDIIHYLVCQFVAMCLRIVRLLFNIFEPDDA